MEDNLKVIGMKIREIRLKKGLTLEELAFKACVNGPHLGQIERGLKNVSLDTLLKLCAALEISPSVLFEEAELNSLPKTSATRLKISAQLESLSEEELKDILKIIKIFRHYRYIEEPEEEKEPK